MWSSRTGHCTSKERTSPTECIGGLVLTKYCVYILETWCFCVNFVKEINNGGGAARGSVVVKALCYKPEGSRLETR
jgi:hypothetical protein